MGFQLPFTQLVIFSPDFSHQPSCYQRGLLQVMPVTAAAPEGGNHGPKITTCLRGINRNQKMRLDVTHYYGVPEGMHKESFQGNSCRENKRVKGIKAYRLS